MPVIGQGVIKCSDEIQVFRKDKMDRTLPFQHPFAEGCFPAGNCDRQGISLDTVISRIGQSGRSRYGQL